MSKRLVFEVKLPIKVTLGVNKRKSYSCNLNAYRNWQHYLKNNVKQEYHKIVKEKIPKIKVKDPVFIKYEYFAKDNRKTDLMNIVSIIDKFFSDVLVELGVLTDDNYEYVRKVCGEYKGKDELKEGYVLAKVYIDIKDKK